MEYNALDIVTDELRAKLQPASQKLIEIEGDRRDRRRRRNRNRNRAGGYGLRDESFYRQRELEDLEALISPDVKADVGANPTGLYELIGT